MEKVKIFATKVKKKLILLTLCKYYNVFANTINMLL